MSKQALNADIDTRAFMQAMRAVQADALPGAVADTLNSTADAVTKEQIRNVKKDLIVRTTYTMKSMENTRAKPYKALNKATGKNVDRMFSRAGTFSPYLWLQEEDQTIEGVNGPRPIATLQARTSKSLRKSVRKAHRIRRTAILRPGEFGDDGKKFVGKPKGGGRRYGLYERSNNNKRLKMLRNLEHNSVKIKGKGFHSKAVKKYGTQQYLSVQFRRQANRRLKRKGVI